MKLTKFKNLTPWQIIIIIAVIIVVIPPLLTIPAFFGFWDFSSTGEIGDTLGGITAPFINGFAAILVFVAFKAQIEANKIFQNQEALKIILDEINLLRNESTKFQENTQTIRANPTQYEAVNREMIRLLVLKNLIYVLSEIMLVYELVKKYEGKEKDFIHQKLVYLYNNHFAFPLSEATKILKSRSNNAYRPEIETILSYHSKFTKHLV